MKDKRSRVAPAVLIVFLLFVFAAGCITTCKPPIGPNVTSVEQSAPAGKKPEIDIRKEFGVTDYQLTLKELEGLRWIKKTKAFAHEKLGFKPTWNYTKFNKGVKLTSIFYHRKDGLFPFSQRDGERIVVLDKKFGKDEASEKKWLADKRRITEKEYDIWMYYPDGVASSEYVTPSFLCLGYFRMTEVVVHEMWHINVRFPGHFEESTCALVGKAGSSMFWYERKEQTHTRLDEWLKFAKAVNLCHAQISELAIRLRDGKINLNEYLLQREKHIKVANQSQTVWPKLTPTSVVHFHTYTHYFPLVHRLYEALDCDLVKFIQALREIDEHGEFQDPIERDLKVYFQKIRATELRIENYVEDIIQKALVEKQTKR